MVMPQAVTDSCPQCGADVRGAGTRCASCGFWLAATPAPRTGPLTARPLPSKDDSGRTMVAILLGGGFVVLGLAGAGAMVWLRRGDAAADARPVVVARAAPSASAAPRR